MTTTPSGFFSYARFDDEYEEKRLTRLRERLEGAIRAHTGMKIDIFQDRKLAWGDNWKETIREAAAGAWFFIPIITPSFFKSTPCAEEFDVFRQHQSKVEREHPDVKVILPIYWIEADELSEPAWREGIPMAGILAEFQWMNWRDLRLEPIESMTVVRMLDDMAKDFKKRLKELGVLRPPAPVRATVRIDLGARVDATGSTALAAAPATEPVAAESLTDRGPGPQPVPRELVVRASGTPGAFATIADALRVAQADDVILVRPGLYKEGIVLDKSLTLVGDGPREEIVIEAEGTSAVLFNAPFGRVANLTLRQNGGGKWQGVDIARGRLILEDCDITSKSLSCVGIHGTAEPTVRRNRIHDGKSAGVVVYENGRGTIEDNDIFGNGQSSLAIMGGGDPLVRRNRIHAGKESGVFVYENGKGTIEDNDVFGHPLAGVQIREGGDPVVRRNRIHDGKQSGVLVTRHGKGTIEDNDIFANLHAGVWVQEEGDPTCRNNRVHKNAGAGVRVHNGGRGTFIENDLRDNVGGAWDITPDCLPNVKREGNIES